MTENEVTAAVWLVGGCVLLFWRSRRKFSRLNSNGIEQHPSHLKMLTSTGLDLMLFSVGTAAMAISALILLLFEQQAILAFLISVAAIYQFRSPR